MDLHATANELDLHDEESNTPDIFTLTSLIDSSAAQQAAERMYAANMNGLRYFSELNRAVPRARAAADSRRLEMAAASEPADAEPIAEYGEAE